MVTKMGMPAELLTLMKRIREREITVDVNEAVMKEQRNAPFLLVAAADAKIENKANVCFRKEITDE